MLIVHILYTVSFKGLLILYHHGKIFSMGHFPFAFLTEIFHICYQHVHKEDEQWAPQPNFWGVDINGICLKWAIH